MEQAACLKGVKGEWASEIFDALEECGFEEHYFQKAKVELESSVYMCTVMGRRNLAKA